MRSVLFCSFILSLLTLTGCAKNGPEVVSISGKVTREGNLYPYVFLNFEPEKGRPSWAQVDGEGKYTVKYDNTQDGAVTGKHKVWISYRAKDPKEEMIKKGFNPGTYWVEINWAKATGKKVPSADPGIPMEQTI